MFNKHMKYGIDERAPYAEADMDASQLIDFLKVDLPRANLRMMKILSLPRVKHKIAMGPPGPNFCQQGYPSISRMFIPDRGTGYSKALKGTVG